MQNRERLLTALNHQQPDKIPLDFGGCSMSSINIHAYRKFQKHVGIKNEAEIANWGSQLARIDEEVLSNYDVDTRPASISDRNIDQEKRSTRYTDLWGAVWQKSGEGPYINRGGPFSDLKDPEPADLEDHDWPDPEVLGNVSSEDLQQARQYHREGYAVVGALPVRTISQAQRMRGFDNWLKDCVRNPSFARALVEKCVEIGLEATKKQLRAIGDLLDVVVWADDMGTSQGPMISPRAYREIVKDSQGRIVRTVKDLADVKVLIHSDGSIYSFLPDLIEIGVDAINPVQHNLGNVKDMDPQRLKNEFGDDLAFWGGIDTSTVLPRRKPDEVREEVKKRIDQLGSGGGYVVASVHNIQAEVPPENVAAYLEAVREYRS